MVLFYSTAKRLHNFYYKTRFQSLNTTTRTNYALKLWNKKVLIFNIIGANLRAKSEKVQPAVCNDTAKEDYLQTLVQYQEILIDYPYLQNNDKVTMAY